MNFIFTSHFKRKFKKLSDADQSLFFEKLRVFEHNMVDPVLKVHKLKGKFAGFQSFSLNYSHRVIFRFEKNQVKVFLYDIGDHSIYES